MTNLSTLDSDSLFAEESDETEDEVENYTKLPTTDSEIEAAYDSLSFRVIYQTSNFFLPQIHELVKAKDTVNLRPEYQRRLRWNKKQKALLIESLLLNIPIPSIFLYESDLAQYEVMDGQQRLNTIYEFLENEFKLTGLEKIPFLNNKRYSELPPKIKRALSRASISAVVLLKETRSDTNDPYIVRRLVFERLNTGGRSLNPQEMRNSIYRGKFNNALVELAKNKSFCSIFGIPIYTEIDNEQAYENSERQKNSFYKSMMDCQIILRFFALKDNEFISGSMRSMLDGCMKRMLVIKDKDDPLLIKLKDDFSKLIEACEYIFGEEAFLLPEDNNGTRRVSIAMYDAIMVAMYRNIDSLQVLKDNRSEFKSNIDSLFISETGDINEINTDLLKGKANTSQSIKDRIKLIVMMIEKTIELP